MNHVIVKLVNWGVFMWRENPFSVHRGCQWERVSSLWRRKRINNLLKT